MDDLSPAFHGLLDAGFTPEELRAIATDLQFGYIAASETGGPVTIHAADSVKWTLQKRLAWNAAVGEFLGHVEHPDDRP